VLRCPFSSVGGRRSTLTDGARGCVPWGVRNGLYLINHLLPTRLLISRSLSIPWMTALIPPRSARGLSTRSWFRPCSGRPNLLGKTLVMGSVPKRTPDADWLLLRTGEMAFGELAFTWGSLFVIDIVKNGDAGKHPPYVPSLILLYHEVIELLPHSHIHSPKSHIQE
jgi:hypothetical protein